jgi:hypothetical protein
MSILIEMRLPYLVRNKLFSQEFCKFHKEALSADPWKIEIMDLKILSWPRLLGRLVPIIDILAINPIITLKREIAHEMLSCQKINS